MVAHHKDGDKQNSVLRLPLFYWQGAIQEDVFCHIHQIIFGYQQLQNCSLHSLYLLSVRVILVRLGILRMVNFILYLCNLYATDGLLRVYEIVKVR